MSQQSSPGRAERTLALVYHPESFPMLQLVEAAHGVCSIAWVVDSSIDGCDTASRLLRRFGSVVDVAGMDGEQAARAISELRPDGIISFKDSRLRFTAELAQRLGLGFHPPEVAARLTDKYAQRVALRDAGVPVPGFRVVPPLDDADAWRELEASLVFPAVLKPRRDNEASRDTVRVESAEELRKAASLAEAECVVEEYLGDRVGATRPCFADYVSVESVVSGGRASHIAVNGRFPVAWPFRESGFFIEAELTDADRRSALQAASAALAAVGIQDGCAHTEIKFTPGGARVIEVNGRIGGGVPEMLADVSDVALLEVAMRIALGEQVHLEVSPVTERVAFLFYVHAPAWMRRIISVEGLDRLCTDPNVTAGVLNRGPADTVDWREGNHGHVFSVRGTVADHDALEVMDRRVHTEVTIEGE